jgi:hypothetical protein
LSVYQDPTFPADDTSTISDYQSSGCWTDDSPSGRTLVYQQTQLDPSTMTVEECLFTCKDAGYYLAGVEFAVRENLNSLVLHDPMYMLNWCSRVNVSVELCSAMALSRSTAACATCNAMATQPSSAEDLLF